MAGVLGILLSLALLMWLAYRGLTVLLLAPMLALLAVLFDGDVRLLAVYTQVFMTALGGFVVKYFPLFLLGAIFGRLMNDSGSAEAVARAIITRLGARNALPAVVLSCAVLTYGGVSVFVVVFAVYPIAATLLRQARIPKRLMPAAIVLGAGTFTMTALPGAPTIQNALPMPYFGTDLYAAPWLGLVAGALMLAAGLTWPSRRQAHAAAGAEGYGDRHADAHEPDGSMQVPRVMTALLPLAVVIGGTLVFSRVVIPSLDTSYLAEPRFGSVTIDEVRGLWALIAALTLAIVLTVILHRHAWTDLKGSLNQGTMSSLLPIFNTASEVGYGTVVASLAGFALVRDQLLGLWPETPLVSGAIAINVMAGITGSASGGLGIALAALGARYLELAQAAGISPEVFHRVAVMASGGLDTLPHNGAVITMLGICGLTHRESYGDIFIVSLVLPVAVLAVVLAGGIVIGVF
jgi:H+/gluconate symporter-like permease